KGGPDGGAMRKARHRDEQRSPKGAERQEGRGAPGSPKLEGHAGLQHEISRDTEKHEEPEQGIAEKAYRAGTRCAGMGADPLGCRGKGRHGREKSCRTEMLEAAHRTSPRMPVRLCSMCKGSLAQNDRERARAQARRYRPRPCGATVSEWL